MDRKTMLERFLESVDRAREFEVIANRLAPGLTSIATLRELCAIGAEHYEAMWRHWENMGEPQRNYVRAWRDSALDTMTEFCMAYVAERHPEYVDIDAGRYPVESITSITVYEHNYYCVVQFDINGEAEIYFSNLSTNQNGMGQD